MSKQIFTIQCSDKKKFDEMKIDLLKLGCELIEGSYKKIKNEDGTIHRQSVESDTDKLEVENYSTGVIKRVVSIIEGEKRDGKFISWYENGQKSSITTIKDGKQDGLETSWYFNGQKEEEGIYKDGEEDGLWTSWHENGQKKTEGIYKNGKEHGNWVYWSPDGNECLEMIWKDGKEWNGKSFSFYIDVSPGKKIEAIYRNGKEHGNWVYWSPDGKECSEMRWKDGKKWNGTLTTWIDEWIQDDRFLKRYEEIYEDYKLTKERRYWGKKGRDSINKIDKIRIERTYKDGFLERITHWDPSGFLFRMEINEDKPALPASPEPYIEHLRLKELSNFKAIDFHHSGAIIREAMFKRGEFVKVLNEVKDYGKD